MTNYSKVGNFLVKEGLVDSAGLDRALETCARSGASLGKALAELSLADENAVTAAIAKLLHLEHLNQAPAAIVPEVRALLPIAFCRKHRLMPLSLTGKSLRLAMVDPTDASTIQDIIFKTSKQVVAVAATETMMVGLTSGSTADDVADSQQAFEMLSGATPEGQVEALDDVDDAVDADELAKRTNLTPVVRLVNLILSGAARDGASDIHIEPKEKYLQVRQRVDGLLQEVTKIPKHLQDATISRMKIISGMDIADRRRAQDGRSTLKFEGQRIDLRVSTLPTQFGEKVVVRLLTPLLAQATLDSMDFSPENLEAFKLQLVKRQGMILITGPTGSGKSSTVYSALNWVKSPTKNIITVEDPIEFQLEGINQVQINPKAGVTFAAGLRSILRQDPNIILVGEIRDKETASIALEAAQTGHLLLSTLHTNDAPSTVSRLLDLGVEPFFVASALIGILAQRLVRRPCSACAILREPSEDVVRRIGGRERLPANGKWLATVGCRECKETGFKGRIAIHEFLQVSDELRDLISRHAPEHDMRRAARAAGMRTLLEDGILKASLGMTTLEAVLEVVSAAETVPTVAPTVAVTAPVVVAAAVEPEDDAVAHPPTAADAPHKSAGERVLVVEDSRTIAAVVKYYLELEGFEVLVANDGLIGLEMARRELPHVIVADLNMPGMDGLAMVKELRADARTRDIAIAMLTSEASVESETLAFAGGADDYMLKPVEPRRLAARVKALAARSRVAHLSATA